MAKEQGTGDWITRAGYARGGSVSNTPAGMNRPIYGSGGQFSNSAVSNMPNLSFTAGGVKSGTAARPGANLGTTADRMARDYGVKPAGGATPNDPRMAFLNGLMAQALGGSGGGAPDLSAYNRQLQFLASEKKRMKSRYKKYTAAISDIYGTLTGVTQKMIENIGPSAEMQSAQLGAMEAQQAEATRATEDQRLGTATEARANLGLEELAGEYAGGDVVTDQSEGMIADNQDLSAAAQNTIASNRAIAELGGQNQILGYGLAQEQSQLQLARSLEDALAAIRAEQVAVRNQKAAAKAAPRGGSGPNYGAALDIYGQIEGITNPQASGEPNALESFQSRYPSLAVTAQTAADTFSDWVTNNYETIPSVKMGKNPSNKEILDTFKAQVPQAQQWLNNYSLMSLLTTLANAK